MNMFDDMFFEENFNTIAESNMNNLYQNNNLNTNMYSPYEGYMKGNMFKDLYKPYKNYKEAKLVPNSEKAEMLLNLNQIAFMNQDLRLYLDNYPNDQEMISKYNENNRLIDELMKRYESKYGPLLCTSLSSRDRFTWATTTFPWEEVNR